MTNNVNELIEKARRHVSDGVGGGVALAHELADALESEHTEVERLRESHESLSKIYLGEQRRHDDCIERAERAEAELAEIRVEWGMDAWQTRTKAAEADNARLTADRDDAATLTNMQARTIKRLTTQLQAVQEASDWAKEHGSDSVDAYQLDAILDATTDEALDLDAATEEARSFRWYDEDGDK